MYERILVVVDRSATSRAAVLEGVAMARVHAAEVVFFSVLPRYVMPVTEMPMIGLPTPEEFQREVTAGAQRALAAASVVADKSGVRCKTVLGAGVDDAECIIDAAKKRRCGLIVVASAGRNAVMRILSGSAIPGLITHSTLPVLVVRQREAKPEAARKAALPLKSRAVRRKPAAEVRARRRVSA